MLKTYASIFCKLLLLLTCLSLAACVSSPRVTAPQLELADWLEQAKEYQQALGQDHPDRIEQIVSLTPHMRSLLQDKFGHLPRRRAARALATWLMASDGHQMQYDTHANFSPIDAFAARRGNCLSFTILLTSMASELGIGLQYNEVDMPDLWELNVQNNGMLLYRHVNAIYKTSNLQVVFDLAIADYDSRYPQRIIEQHHAIALLHNNLSMEALLEEDYERSFHRIKLAIATDPSNSDIWGNLGVLLKRSGNLHLSEQAFLRALEIDRSNSAAASNLERVYRTAGKQKLASKYERLSRLARLNNPYFHYEKAKQAFLDKDFKSARKDIKKAKKLHDQDSRFFVLSSQIEKQLKNYLTALEDLQVAFELSNSQAERGRFVAKAEAVAQLMAKRNLQQQRMDQGRQIDLLKSRSGL